VDPILVTWYSFYFSFLFSLQPPIPKLTKPSKKKKKNPVKGKRKKEEEEAT